MDLPAGTHTRRRARAAVAVVAGMAFPCLVACASSPVPGLDPLRYFRAGVAPHREARRVVNHLEGAGYSVRKRIEGETFVALAFARPQDGASAVRIITRRGIAVALDAPTEGRPAAGRVGLRAPRGDHHDLDGDGRPEIAVRLHDARRERTCVAVMRVLQDGRVVEMGLRRDPTPTRCIERLHDVDGNGSLEALMGIRYPELAMGRTPEVFLPLVSEGDEWVVATPPALEGYWNRARARRKRAVERAREDVDIRAGYRLAVEMAALARGRGEPTRAQVRAFDDALRGLVPSEAQARRIERVRRYIEAGWKGEP